MHRFGVGMIGFGFIGKVHAHAHRSLPLFFDPAPAVTDPVAVCTTSEETGRKAMAAAGFSAHTTDYRELIGRSDVQIVHICTPNDAHFAAIKAALEAGKHVYCDKPLALNSAEADALAALAANSNGAHQMTFNYRFVPAIQRAAELIDSGFLGELFSFRARYLHAGYIDPRRPFSWRTDFARSGGGAIMDLGAHVIDLVTFLLDRPAVPRGGAIAEVCATLETLIPERTDPRTGAARAVDVDDIAVATCRLAGGAVGVIEASRLATGVQDELRLELHGSRGGLRFNLMDPNWLDAYDATTPEAPYGGDRGFRRIESVTRYPRPYALGATKNTVGWLNFHIHSLHDFVENAVRREAGLPMRPESPTFADGASVQRVVATCQASSAAGGAWSAIAARTLETGTGQGEQKPLQ